MLSSLLILDIVNAQQIAAVNGVMFVGLPAGIATVLDSSSHDTVPSTQEAPQKEVNI